MLPEGIPTPDWKDDRYGVALYCADCMDVLPELPKVDAVVTDPPYGIGFAARPTHYQRDKGMVARDWDDTTPNVLPLLTAANQVAVWGGNHFPMPPSRCWLSWYKPDIPVSFGNVEYCWTNLDSPPRCIKHSISATNGERVGHPTQKPLGVMKWCIGHLPDSAHTILDPFAGSGTTGVAAVHLGRAFIGIEKDPDYFQIAVDRIRQAIIDVQGGELFAEHTPAQLSIPEETP